MWSSRIIPPVQTEVQTRRHYISQVQCPLLLTDQNVSSCVCRAESLDLDKNFHKNQSNVSPDALKKMLRSPDKVPFFIVRPWHKLHVFRQWAQSAKSWVSGKSLQWKRKYSRQILLFVCPCIVRIIRNWWPTRCNFWFIYLYPISSTCFGRCFHPSSGALDCIYSFWYSPPLLLPAGVLDEMELSFHLVHNTDWQQHSSTISEAVNIVKCSWWWAKTSPKRIELIE